MNNPNIIGPLLKLRMEETKREVQETRPLQGAGISRMNWLARGAHALLNLFTVGGKDLRSRHSVELESYRSSCNEIGD